MLLSEVTLCFARDTVATGDTRENVLGAIDFTLNDKSTSHKVNTNRNTASFLFCDISRYLPMAYSEAALATRTGDRCFFFRRHVSGNLTFRETRRGKQLTLAARS